MQRLFRQQLAVVLARLQSPKLRRNTRHDTLAPGEKTLDIAYVFDRGRWDREVRRVIGGTITRIVQDTGDALFAMFVGPDGQPKAAYDRPLAASFNVHDPQVTAALDERVNRIVNINATTEDAIRQTLQEGEMAGEGIPKLANRVRGVFGEASRVRARTIARTEVVGAVNQANFMAAGQTGLDITKQWLAIHDDRVRETHARADGQERAMDEPFSIGGHSMMYPGDPSGPSHETINCRCTLIYGGDELSAGATRLDASEDEVLDGAGVLTDEEARGLAVAHWNERHLLRTRTLNEAIRRPSAANARATRLYPQNAQNVNKAARAGNTRYAPRSWTSARRAGDRRSLIDALDESSYEGALKHDTLLYRGGAMSKKDIDRLMNGRWLDDAYTSTTLDKNLAARYAADAARQGKKVRPVVFEMATQKGTPAFRGAGNLREVVLGRGTQWRLLDIYEKNGITYLRVENLMLPRTPRIPFDPHRIVGVSTVPKPFVTGLGTKASPLITNDPLTAARAIGQGKWVQLEQERYASTMLDRVDEFIRGSTTRFVGENPVYNLAHADIHGTNLFIAPTGAPNVPRIEMPQLSGVPVAGSWADTHLVHDVRGEVDLTPTFTDYLQRIGIGSHAETVDAAFLRASQNELSGKNVRQLMTYMEEGTYEPHAIVVTKDLYVLDGHHRWAALVAEGWKEGAREIPVDVVVIDAPITDVLRIANTFTTDYGLPHRAVTQALTS